MTAMNSLFNLTLIERMVNIYHLKLIGVSAIFIRSIGKVSLCPFPVKYMIQSFRLLSIKTFDISFMPFGLRVCCVDRHSFPRFNISGHLFWDP